MQQPNILKALADNQALFDEVKALLLAEFDIPYAEGASNEQLGEITRARIVGRAAVESAFQKIANHRTHKPPEVKRNEMR